MKFFKKRIDNFLQSAGHLIHLGFVVLQSEGNFLWQIDKCLQSGLLLLSYCHNHKSGNLKILKSEKKSISSGLSELALDLLPKNTPAFLTRTSFSQ